MLLPFSHPFRQPDYSADGTDMAQERYHVLLHWLEQIHPQCSYISRVRHLNQVLSATTLMLGNADEILACLCVTSRSWRTPRSQRCGLNLQIHV